MKKTLLYITILLGAIACKPQTTTTDHLQVWLHRANSIEKAQFFQGQYRGLEIDVYYIDSLNMFLVKHNVDDTTTLTLDHWCGALDQISRLGIWFDFKNLSSLNCKSALRCLTDLRDKYELQGMLIVESTAYDALPSFRKAGFQDSYYIPPFDPETVDSIQYQQYVEKIQDAILSGVTHLSGYDYQYDFMKREFPEQRKLLWTLNRQAHYQDKLIEKIGGDTLVDVLLVPDDPY